MNIKPLHPNFQIPTQSSRDCAGFDLYMPESGELLSGETKIINLGFAAAVPRGYVGLILPRSGVGSRHGLELFNTCGVIDSDYRGEWKAALSTKRGQPFSWEAGDRLLQLVIIPVTGVILRMVDELDTTSRGVGGFGSTGK